MNDFKIMAVTGNPVLHSKSPQIFNTILSTDDSGTYTRLAADNAEEALWLMQQIGLCGLNVTAPFKQTMLKCLKSVDRFAIQAGGVNCVTLQNGFFHGFNSDLAGVSESFVKAGINLKGRKVALIGAGGAARAALCALLQADAQVWIVNRTESKAKRLANEFGCNFASLSDLPVLLKSTDILISTLAAEHNMIEPEWLNSDLTVFDADYKQGILARQALAKGCRVIQGEEWLLNQAIPAYREFTGRKPDEKVMRAALLSAELLNCSRIALTGFMGSGKSSVGKMLADRLGRQFYDTDQLIEQQSGESIPEIFKNQGETEFRRRESIVLEQLAGLENIVVATGGGIVVNPSNRNLLKRKFLPIWLYGTAAELFERVKGSNRPLLDCAEPQKRAEQLYEQRNFLYAQTAELIINTERKNVQTITERLHAEISRII